jgi:hypothetical protein
MSQSNSFANRLAIVVIILIVLWVTGGGALFRFLQ